MHWCDSDGIEEHSKKLPNMYCASLKHDQHVAAKLVGVELVEAHINADPHAQRPDPPRRGGCRFEANMRPNVSEIQQWTALTGK